MKEQFNDWYYTKPPKQAIVWATYSLSEPWRLVKTCKRGCCVSDGISSLILPDFWKPASLEDAASFQTELDAQPPPINMWELYARSTP